MKTILEINNFYVKVQNNFKKNTLFNERILLSDINLTVKEGDIVLLTGNNGSGKSTLLNTIAQSMPQHTEQNDAFHFLPFRQKPEILVPFGEIIFHGSDEIKNLRLLAATEPELDSFHQQIYHIEQDKKIPETVLQFFYEVMEPIGEEKKVCNNWRKGDCVNCKIRNDTEKTCLVKFLKQREISRDLAQKKSEDLINYNLTSSGLSGGEKKILEILSAIMRSESKAIKLLLLDEPFNHLDVKNIMRMVSLIEDLRKINPELAIIVTTHCHAFENVTQYLYLLNGSIETKNPAKDYKKGHCFDERLAK
jgi:ABC-type multidrug transport system ATPase subunit